MNLITTVEAAEILGVTDSHVRRLILTGKLPAMKFGARTLLLQRADVEAYAKEHPRSKAGRPRTTPPQEGE